MTESQVKSICLTLHKVFTLNFELDDLDLYLIEMETGKCEITPPPKEKKVVFHEQKVFQFSWAQFHLLHW